MSIFKKVNIHIYLQIDATKAFGKKGKYALYIEQLDFILIPSSYHPENRFLDEN